VLTVFCVPHSLDIGSYKPYRRQLRPPLTTQRALQLTDLYRTPSMSTYE